LILDYFCSKTNNLPVESIDEFLYNYTNG